MTQSSEEFESFRWTLIGMYLCIVSGICLLLAVHVHIHRPLLMNGDEVVRERTVYLLFHLNSRPWDV
jgi:hypothetical protein